MAGRALPSSALLFLLVAGSSQALAQDEGNAVGEPNPGGERVQASASPKLLGSGKGTDGTHVFLFGRQGAPPVIYMGQPGQLSEVEVLAIERYPGKFVVDTFEHGEMVFNTPNKGSKKWSVTIPGEIGFGKPPAVVMSGEPDQAVFLEAMQRMGYVRRTPLSSQTLPASIGRLVENLRLSSSLAGGDRQGRFTAMQGNSSTRMKARNFRRPTARFKGPRTRARTTGRTTARVR